jgi:hypothetical protein
VILPVAVNYLEDGKGWNSSKTLKPLYFRDISQRRAAIILSFCEWGSWRAIPLLQENQKPQHLL